MAIDPVTATLIASTAISTGKGLWDSWQQGKRNKSNQKLVDQFLQKPSSQFVNPALLKQAQGYAGGGGGGDPLLQSTAEGWLGGEGGIPYDTNLANQLLRGDIPPSVAASLDRQIGTRFDRLRRNQGGQLARSGILNSSMGGRLMADTYDSQRNAPRRFLYEHNALATTTRIRGSQLRRCLSAFLSKYGCEPTRTACRSESQLSATRFQLCYRMPIANSLDVNRLDSTRGWACCNPIKHAQMPDSKRMRTYSATSTRTIKAISVSISRWLSKISSSISY